MVVALHAVRGGQEMLVLVLPEGARAFLRSLVDGPTDRGLDVFPSLVEGQDLGVRSGAGIPERALRVARVLRVRLGGPRNLHEALHRLPRLREVLDVDCDDVLVVYEVHGGARFALLVAVDLLVSRES